MLYLPESIYKKDNKLSKVSSVMDDEFIKNNVYILVHYEELIKNKKVIKDLKKNGYKFAVLFNNTVEVSETNQSILSISDYMFMDKKKVDTNKVLSSIHFDTKGKVIYEDLEGKVENYGGE
jgi:pentose-5-phosphate-3-epimerase